MATDGSQGERELMMEVQLLSSCSHPNVLKLLGHCLDARGSCLVYPLARGGAAAHFSLSQTCPSSLCFCTGDLEARLMRSPDSYTRLSLLGIAVPPAPLTWQLRLRIVRDIMRGLLYLHVPTATKQRVLHRDVVQLCPTRLHVVMYATSPSLSL